MIEKVKKAGRNIPDWIWMLLVIAIVLLGFDWLGGLVDMRLPNFFTVQALGRWGRYLNLALWGGFVMVPFWAPGWWHSPSSEGARETISVMPWRLVLLPIGLGLWGIGYWHQSSVYDEQAPLLKSAVIAMSLSEQERAYLVQRIDAAKPGLMPWDNGERLSLIEAEAKAMTSRRDSSK